MAVNVQAAEGQRMTFSDEARARLGRVYAFLLSLPDRDTSDGDQAGEQAPSEAGHAGKEQVASAREV